ncbi:pilus (MSHA type) biogenesis protein MshL [Burkholderiaceae bacterium DAT-1]|nr:pilus (MSHA type) biogenesis protein MshL [Burkholderiaceae bacterium DAT-1]
MREARQSAAWLSEQEQAALREALTPPAPPPPAQSTAVNEARFDVVVNEVPAAQVLLGMVEGTRYSMILPPDIGGKISMNLHDVTVPEALSAIRQVYGIEYRIEGNRIAVLPQSLQTRVMQISYLDVQRRASSEVRVLSGSMSDNNAGNGIQQNQSATPGNVPANNGNNSGNSASNFVSSRVVTQARMDFWGDFSSAIHAIVGEGEGRKVVVNPQTGVIVVRALPSELASVEAFIRASRLALERQVILEAKIMEVQLNNQFQAGINWAAFGHSSNPGTGFSGGMLQAGVSTSNTGATTGSALTGMAGKTLTNATTGSLFGVVFQSNNFSAVLAMLEQQGKVNVLSSPRIAALNNQPAVLKVGTDDFFVTNVSTTTTTGTATTSTPSVTLQPFFSGISLDVTPVIDTDKQVTLHVHPSISQVSTVNQQINLGSQGTISLPLASSNVSETDSVVRGRDGQIIALGGLIRESLVDNADQLPVLGGLPVVGHLFRSNNKQVQRRELVILIKPTVVDSGLVWSDTVGQYEKRLESLLDRDHLNALR